MSIKLYYTDSYIKEMTATVIDVKREGELWAVALDRTAFVPEGGGQRSDTGVINGVPVLDVKEEGELIYHIMPQPLTLGESVEGCVDFDKRFVKMQCHTAEHILCGIIHNLYGYENVGFHLGDEVVTFDIDGELIRSQLDEVELLANKVVFDNLPITVSLPDREQLSALTYRSKLEFAPDELVRIVRIGDIDACACCAPHVSRTGEVGLIKILDFMRHRGGVRITMVAGYRALGDYSHRYTTDKAIGGLLSTPAHDILDAVRHLHAEHEAAKHKIDNLYCEMARLGAQRVPMTPGNAVYCFRDMPLDALREFSNLAKERVGGILVALSGADGDYKYIISSRSHDLRAEARDINAALCGRGGGRPEMIQGSFGATVDEIKAYFKA